MRYLLLLGGVVSALVVGVALLLQLVVSIDVHALITTSSLAAALAIVVLLGLDLVLPVPSSLVMILSGVTFGFLAGGCLSLLGSLAGNMAAFELSRRYGVVVCKRLVGEGEFQRIDRLLAHYGPVAIMVTRPMPVLMETVSLMAGLSAMKRGTFVFASLGGTLPLVFVYAYAGAFALQRRSLLPVLLLSIGVVVMGWVGARFLLKRGSMTPAS